MLLVHLMAGQVKPVFKHRLGGEAELPEKRRHVAMVAALVQEQMEDQLTSAVAEALAVDIDRV